MVYAQTSEWTAEFFDDVAPLVPGLKGPSGASLPLPIGDLAAGMRTPPHLVSPRPGSNCTGGGGVGGGGSARVSPRGSFNNRDLAASLSAAGPGQATSPAVLRGSVRGAR